MKAAVYEKYGPPEVVQIRETSKPTPRDNEILVRIIATTLHRGDTRMRSLSIPGSAFEPAMGRLFIGVTGPKRKILGMELAGIVEYTGKNVAKFSAGDQVFASMGLNFGAHAEYACLPEDGMVALMPSNMSFDEAVPVPASGCGALVFLRDTGRIKSGDRVLINGASGALGTYGVQIAKYFGAEVTGVCSTDNLAFVKCLGADYVIDYTKEDFTQGEKQYDLIFDAVSKSSKQECKDILASDGRYIQTSGSEPKLRELFFLKEIIEAGKIITVIDRRYTLDEIVEAHRYVDKGHKKGNVIINVAETQGKTQEITEN